MKIAKIKTSDISTYQDIIDKIFIPQEVSHKGQNGKILVIGGSKLFHAASLWAAEVATHFTDMVHYSSTKENNEIFLSLKKVFRNGIVFGREDLDYYIEEDDCVLIGPGMERGTVNRQLQITNYKDIGKLENEAEITYFLTKYLLEKYPKKRFVFDAGALQMMELSWLKNMHIKPILTPHKIEFENLFKVDLHGKNVEEIACIVKEKAEEYNCVILLKIVKDIVSDGKKTAIIEGGNAGLTKGGTGDVLSGLVASFYTKNDAFDAACVSSILLKKTAEDLFEEKGIWFNISDLINKLPAILKNLLYN